MSDGKKRIFNKVCTIFQVSRKFIFVVRDQYARPVLLGFQVLI